MNRVQYSDKPAVGSKQEKTYRPRAVLGRDFLRRRDARWALRVLRGGSKPVKVRP